MQVNFSKKIKNFEKMSIFTNIEGFPLLCGVKLIHLEKFRLRSSLKLKYGYVPIKQSSISLKFLIHYPELHISLFFKPIFPKDTIF